ncbi:MAG TPA: (Fe-S)-binding protein [Anaerolineae bacterium]|nr:(Fe-S)-binding protein [Anaerolineae bacterium]
MANEVDTDIKDLVELFRDRIKGPIETSLEVCAHCGLCADSCHVYAGTGDVDQIPSARAQQLERVYKRYFTRLGRIAPRLVGAQELDEEVLDRLQRIAYQCTLCRRCALFCPFGIDNASMVSAIRSLLADAGRVPAALEEHTNNAYEKGNTLAISEEQFLDRVEWFEEELQDAVDDDEATIPLDKEGARMFFVPTPIQIMRFPSVIISAAKIFYAAGEDWTMSTQRFDATNFALFSGEEEKRDEIAQRLVDEMGRLGAEVLVLTECGHSYWSMKYAVQSWLGKPLAFEVKNIVELTSEYISEGRIKLDPSVHKQLTTYHDPCNLSRKGGLLEQPRACLQAACEDFVELTPSGAEAWCCGGGGGVIAIPEYDEVRIASGKKKAEQIRQSGAQVVATACDNCKLQLIDLAEHYGLDVSVIGVTDLVAESLIMDEHEE